MFRFDRDFPEIDGQEEGRHSQDHEEFSPREEVQAKGDKNGHGKDGETGSRVVKP